MLLLTSLIVLSTTATLFYRFLLKTKYPNLSSYQDKKIIIIGTGFSGILCAISLKKMKFNNFVIYEKQKRVGGAWAKNTYPGCECDVYAHLYSYSFEQNPNWSKKFPGWQQIQVYIEGVAKKYGIFEHIKFDSDILESKYNEKECKWNLKIKNANVQIEDQCDFVVSCVGGVNIPSYPDFVKKGKDIFKGKIMHTAEYDNDYKIEGKKIALIGNSASGVQVMPHLQKAANKFYQFQRTPIHMVEKKDSNYSSIFIKLCQKVPGFIKLYRIYLYCTYEMFFPFFRFQVMLNFVQKMILKQMKKTTSVLSEEDKKHVYPSYQFGTHKPALSSDFYKVISAENAKLVPHGVKQLTENGITATNGEHFEVDCIVLATGFHLNQISFPVYGLKNIKLQDQWEGVPKTYLGTSNPNFPNFLQMSGANSVFTHNSQLIAIECQQNYINQMLSYILKNNVKQIDVKQDVFDDYQKYLDEKISHMPYKNNPIKKVLMYAGTTPEYWLKTKFFYPQKYNIVK